MANPMGRPKKILKKSLVLAVDRVVLGPYTSPFAILDAWHVWDMTEELRNAL